MVVLFCGGCDIWVECDGMWKWLVVYYDQIFVCIGSFVGG